ncbi:MAG: 3-deoxy-D-manno-octulosonic acid transferase [Candidatus Limimorpha sp.]
MRLLYSSAIRCYSGMIRLAAAFGNKKARLWIGGRKKQWEKLAPQEHGDKWIWMHVSSLGEFEQGLPIIEALRQRYPGYKLLLTFFSPSGYEIKKDFPLADIVAYMPQDSMRNAKRLVTNFNFKAVFFVKYEFWFNYIKVLKDNNIPLYYISTLLRPNQYFFKPWGKWFRNQLYNVTHFFTQNKETADLLHGIGIDTVTIAGDTRFDRVYSIAKQSKRFPDIESFIGERKCIIVGSSWPSDEKLLFHFMNRLPDDYCLIIAPHDISQTHIKQIETQLNDYQLYTELDTNKKSKVLVVNTIGILSKIYKYARIAYIGGGFYEGIHNTQEAIVFDVPVVFGQKYHAFTEAVDLVALKGAFSINNKEELESVFQRLMTDNDFYTMASKTCHSYVSQKIGATDIIMDSIKLS